MEQHRLLLRAGHGGLQGPGRPPDDPALFFLGWANPLAYVPNEKSGTLSVIDTRHDRVVDEIPAGSRPRGLAISGERIYVSDQPKNALHVIHTGRRAIERTIELGESPEGVSLSPSWSTRRAARCSPR
jgi:YVTN family beta-propeller protein